MDLLHQMRQGRYSTSVVDRSYWRTKTDFMGNNKGIPLWWLIGISISLLSNNNINLPISVPPPAAGIPARDLSPSISVWLMMWLLPYFFHVMHLVLARNSCPELGILNSILFFFFRESTIDCLRLRFDRFYYYSIAQDDSDEWVVGGVY